MSDEVQVRPLRRPQRVPRVEEPELELAPPPPPLQEEPAADEPANDATSAPEDEVAPPPPQEEPAAIPVIPEPRIVQLVSSMAQLIAQGREADPFAANTLAYEAGLARVKLVSRRQQAEIQRKALFASIVDRLMQQGQARTPAERDARTAPEYVAFEERLAQLDEQERLAELIHSIAFQRAGLLSMRGWHTIAETVNGAEVD